MHVLRLRHCIHRNTFKYVCPCLLVVYLLWQFLPKPGSGRASPPTPVRNERTGSIIASSIDPGLLAEPKCEDGEVSPYLDFVRQFRWVLSSQQPETSPYTLEDTGTLPFIFYDKRLIYHDVFTEGCEYRCRYSSDIKDLQRAHLAVFTQNPPRVAHRYFKRTIWALETGEPIHLMPWIEQQNKAKFTMFITHHSFATVPFYYGVYWAFKKPECSMSKQERRNLRLQNSLPLLPRHHSARSKLLAWVVSNGKAPNMRNKLADAIAQHIPVDKFGRHHKPCPEEFACFNWLSKQYKFYLSFENCNCDGYITEKFFVNALRAEMVPIVYGASREEYFARAPPNSFIHVDDFRTVKELTDYLYYLDKNDTAYASYFAWKEHGEILFWPRIDCRVCGVLHHLLQGVIQLPNKTFEDYFDPKKTCSSVTSILL